MSYLDEIETARKGDYCLWLHLYCEAEGCPAREIVIRVKDYSNELVRLATRLCCPLCGGHRSLSLHDIRDRKAHDVHASREARSSVATQMYERDQQKNHHPGTLLAIPASVFLDDRLPPTPPGWWSIP